jgi:hypothetical protein
VRVEADTNESNTGLFKEVSASKVALYPLPVPPTLPTELSRAECRGRADPSEGDAGDPNDGRGTRRMDASAMG